MISGFSDLIICFSFVLLKNKPFILDKPRLRTGNLYSSNLVIILSAGSLDIVTITGLNLFLSRLETRLNNWLVGPDRLKVDTI